MMDTIRAIVIITVNVGLIAGIVWLIWATVKTRAERYRIERAQGLRDEHLKRLHRKRGRP